MEIVVSRVVSERFWYGIFIYVMSQRLLRFSSLYLYRHNLTKYPISINVMITSLWQMARAV